MGSFKYQESDFKDYPPREEAGQPGLESGDGFHLVERAGRERPGNRGWSPGTVSTWWKGRAGRGLRSPSRTRRPVGRRK
jgi:hypothetical protein